jgi:hypothetical protein
VVVQLKPAGRDFGPAIPASDKAIDDGSIEPASNDRPVIRESYHYWEA